jgi:hypothetical protein
MRSWWNESITGLPPSAPIMSLRDSYSQGKQLPGTCTSLEVPSLDVCIGMDYPFLELRYLEQKMRGSPLHQYTLVFRGSLILRGVELPKRCGPGEAP